MSGDQKTSKGMIAGLATAEVIVRHLRENALPKAVVSGELGASQARLIDEWLEKVCVEINEAVNTFSGSQG